MTYSIGGEGTLDQAFITEAEIIDRYVGCRMFGWGANSTGAIADGTTVAKTSPSLSIGIGWKQICDFGIGTGIKTDGTLWNWGYGPTGALGDNTTVSKSSPVQTVCGGTNWKQAARGNNPNGTAVLAIKTDGTLWCWGAGGNYMLGDGTNVSKSSPVQTIAGGTNWKQVSCGNFMAGAVKTDGTLWMWGTNANGNLGDNSTVTKSSPVQTVAGGTNWKQISCGYRHSGAVKTDGTLWLWGQNSKGALGDNSATGKSSPVQTICGGTNWKQVTCGYFFTGAIKTDGTLWLWGNNLSGNLGDNTAVDKSSPVQTIAGGTNWKQVSLSGYNAAVTAAVKTDGTLWCWGTNASNQLGDNTTVSKSSPVQTVAGGTNWKFACAATGSGNTGLALTYSDVQ